MQIVGGDNWHKNHSTDHNSLCSALQAKVVVHYGISLHIVLLPPYAVIKICSTTCTMLI